MNIIGRLLFHCGQFFSFSYSSSTKFRTIKAYFYTGTVSKRFHKFGRNSLIFSPFRLLKGEKYIEIGDNCFIGAFVQLTAWDRFLDQSFHPNIKIGNGTSIGDHSHITCSNSISIGNGVLMGKKILITDNSHGSSDYTQLDIPPNLRPLYSKGVVIIEDNVWIGEKASILPGVTIGKGSIIGANSVVTKSIPQYSLVGGNPAKVIKTLK